MNEFIEKLIGRLEEYKKQWMDADYLDGIDEIIGIVNQLAEEYNNESVKGDLISRSALIDVLNAERKQDRSKAYGEHECDLIAGTIAMCTDFVKAMPTENDGWIPCSERLPEEDVLEDGYVEPSEAVLVLTKYNSYKVSRYWGNRRNKRDYHDWVDIKYRKNEVIAWKHIAPYQPKGE